MKRILWLDYLRVFACFLVIVVHVPELSESVYEKIYTYSSRIAVPLFFMISGYLTLPFDPSLKNLFKNRLPRLFFPFLTWSIIYAFLPSFFGDSDFNTAIHRFIGIPIALTASHLWYMYAIIGLYIFAPIISPWLNSASRRQILFYLIIWMLTLTFPYIINDTTGIKMDEWNSIFTFYYFTGYLGYFILGFYLKKFPVKLNKWKYKLFFTGTLFLNFLIAFLVLHFLDASFQVTRYLTVNVALFSFSIFMLIKQINFSDNFLSKIIVELSLKSFGIYLIHEFVLKYIYFKKLQFIELPFEFARPLISLFVFLISFIFVWGLSKIPKSKYLIG